MLHLLRSALLVGLCCYLGGCTPPPISLRGDEVLRRVAGDYRAFFPAQGDPDSKQDAGLLRPRFGLPALIPPGARFSVEFLQRGLPAALHLALVRPQLGSEQAARCLATPAVAVDGCHPLRIVETRRQPLTGTGDLAHVELWVEPAADSSLAADSPSASALAPGGYDLYVESAVDAPVRAPRSVWLRSPDADERPLRIAHLSDLHVGKGGRELRENLDRVLADVGAGAPDLVVVTGDLANIGTRPELLGEARALLLQVPAPVVVVIGNHDLGFGPRPILTTGYGAGWANFARAFHPYLLFALTVGHWEFVGFDSGPSVISPRVLVRGLADDTLLALRQILDAAHKRGSRGVVLFSHAPSRAALTTSSDPRHVGLFGRMRRGASAFERVLLDAAPELQEIHLAGHTHWSDLFEAAAPAGQRPQRFHRWAADALGPCPQPLRGQVALITTQSASHSSFPLRRNAQGYGYTWLTLAEPFPQVAFQRYRGPVRERCPLDPT